MELYLVRVEVEKNLKVFKRGFNDLTGSMGLSWSANQTVSQARKK